MGYLLGRNEKVAASNKKCRSMWLKKEESAFGAQGVRFHPTKGRTQKEREQLCAYLVEKSPCLTPNDTQRLFFGISPFLQ